MSNIQARQNDDFYDDRFNDSWWYSRTGAIVKWAVFFGLFFSLLTFIIAGRWHAMKRINNGLQPLGYHRWLLSRRQRALYDPAYRQPNAYYNTYRPQDAQYGMHPMPPPMYDPNSAPPPTYQPPGGHKIDPSQARPQGEASQTYEAPPGPPPAVQPTNTGSSYNPFRR